MNTLVKRLTEGRIATDLRASSAEEAVAATVNLLEDCRDVARFMPFRQEILASIHQEGSYLGNHFALAHTRTDSVHNITLALSTWNHQEIRHPNGQTIEILCVAGIPNKLAAEYLQILGSLVRILSKPQARKQILLADRSTEIIRIFQENVIML